jgi:hypothetical protein
VNAVRQGRAGSGAANHTQKCSPIARSHLNRILSMTGLRGIYRETLKQNCEYYMIYMLH